MRNVRLYYQTVTVRKTNNRSRLRLDLSYYKPTYEVRILYII
jgi:hypothetical protein